MIVGELGSGTDFCVRELDQVTFDPAWNQIGLVDEPISRTVIDEVTEILFAPDPPQHELDRVDYCLVLGSRNCGYKAERAADLFGYNERVTFVACGANLSLSGQPEAELIREILLERGVAAERVLVDEHSTNTLGNLTHAERIINEHMVDPRSQSIAVLSSGFHRLHVLASLPSSLLHAIYVNATGPSTGRDTWHTNPQGRAIILHELRRPSFNRRRSRIPAVA